MPLSQIVYRPTFSGISRLFQARFLNARFGIDQLAPTPEFACQSRAEFERPHRYDRNGRTGFDPRLEAVSSSLDAIHLAALELYPYVISTLS